MWTRSQDQTTIAALLAEIAELRKERIDLTRALADARDRGDRLVNLLLEAKGADPLPPSPSPPLPMSDPWAEDPQAVERLHREIAERGLEAVLNGD